MTLRRDFYRKIPRDMSEGTIPGSVISMCAAGMIAVLLVGPKSCLLDIKTRVTLLFIPPYSFSHRRLRVVFTPHIKRRFG